MYFSAIFLRTLFRKCKIINLGLSKYWAGPFMNVFIQSWSERIQQLWTWLHSLYRVLHWNQVTMVQIYMSCMIEIWAPWRAVTRLQSVLCILAVRTPVTSYVCDLIITGDYIIIKWYLFSVIWLNAYRHTHHIKRVCLITDSSDLVHIGCIVGMNSFDF